MLFAACFVYTYNYRSILLPKVRVSEGKRAPRLFGLVDKTMIRVTLVVGRNGQGAASRFVWCEQYKTGRAFSHDDDMYEAIAALCEALERRLKQPVVCANLGELTMQEGQLDFAPETKQAPSKAPARKGKAKPKGKGGSFGRTGQWRDALTSNEDW